MNKQDNIAINNLKEYFRKNEDVVMAFIFGSRAKENVRPGSDWDIAVYFTPREGYLEWEEQDREYLIEDRVWSDCVEILKTDDVDLIVLNRIAASIAATAIRGIPLVVKDYDLWLKFMLIITQEAEDYREYVDDYYAISQHSASLIPQDRESLKKTISFLEEQMSIYSYFNIKWKRISDFIQNSQEYFQALMEAAKGYLANSGEI